MRHSIDELEHLGKEARRTALEMIASLGKGHVGGALSIVDLLVVCLLYTSGGDGATHAAIEDIAIMRSFPNMTVVQPADAVAARALAHAAVDFNGPLYIRLHRNPVADLYSPSNYRFEWGKARTCLLYTSRCV